jgi:hypothetical protein
LNSFHLHLVSDTVVYHAGNFKADKLACLLSCGLFLFFSGDFVVKCDDLLSCVESFELLSELYELFFQGLDQSIESVLYSLLIPAKLLLGQTLPFMDLINEFFVLHELACPWMISLTLCATKTIGYCTASSYANLGSTTIMLA